MIERLVQVPEECVAPEELLARLRTLDARAELVYAGEGRWLYGYVSSHYERQQIGERILAREAAKDPARRRRSNWLLGELVRQGFQLVATFEGADPAPIYHIAAYHAQLRQLGEKKLDELFEAALDAVTIEDERDARLRAEFGDLARRELPTVLRVVRRGVSPISLPARRGAAR